METPFFRMGLLTNSSLPRCYTQRMRIIYVDRLFISELLCDYLLLLTAGRVSALYLRRGRYLLAALLGAAYSVCVLLPDCAFLSGGLCKLASALLMGLIAYGGEQSFLRCTAVFLAVSAVFGGVLWAVSISGGLDLRVLALSFAVCYTVLRLITAAKGRRGRDRCEAELELDGRRCRMSLLVDSGNCLCDPVSGAGVIVVQPNALRPLLAEAAALLELGDAVELLEASAAYPQLQGKIRLIPYSSVGGSGLLPAFRADALRVDGRERDDLLIAIAQSAGGDGYDGIIQA